MVDRHIEKQIPPQKPNQDNSNLFEEWKDVIVVPVDKKRDKTDCSNYRGISLLSTTYKILSNILHIQRTLLGIINVDFDTIGHLLIIYFAFVKIVRKKMEIQRSRHGLFIDLKKAYGSVGRAVLYSILITFGIHKKMVRLIKICLSETYSIIREGKYFCGMFPIKNYLGGKRDTLSSLLFKSAVEYAIRRVQVNQDGLKLYIIYLAEAYMLFRKTQTP
jgi:hypothetical protein